MTKDEQEKAIFERLQEKYEIYTGEKNDKLLKETKKYHEEILEAQAHERSLEQKLNRKRSKA